jgi:hypothetical protein
MYYFDNFSLYPIYTPPTPTWIQNQVDSVLGVNHIWQAGTGNVTDSWMVQYNGEWYNYSSNAYYVSSIAPLEWSNISVCGYNNTGVIGACITNNSQAPMVPVSGVYPPLRVTNVTRTQINATWVRIQWDVTT